MARRRRIAVVTGSRAEYGLLRPVMSALQKITSVRLQVVVTGMHLLRSFGYTIQEVRQDGFKIDARVATHPGGDGPLSVSKALSNGVSRLAQALERLDSDVVVVLGDRVEALAAALAATTTDRVVAHIHGGDVAPGHLDDAFRHAITKLAHLHFAATTDAARRLIRLGESPQHVHLVGAPGLDELLNGTSPPDDWLCARFRLPASLETALILQHPIGRPARVEQRVMANVMRAVQTEGLCGLVIYPNSDPGHSGIVKAIDAALRRRSWCCRVAASLPRTEFLQCLRAARVLVGNSSAGIIEAPFTRTASVNVGVRQQGRVRGGRSVIDCGEGVPAVRAALRTALALRFRGRRGGVYGTGNAGQRIAGILAATALSDNLRRKRIHR